MYPPILAIFNQSNLRNDSSNSNSTVIIIATKVLFCYFGKRFATGKCFCTAVFSIYGGIVLFRISLSV